MLYDIGDKVYCKIRGITIVDRSVSEFDVMLSFEIIGYDKPSGCYVIHVPLYYNIKNRFCMQETQLAEYNIDKKYINKNGFRIGNCEIVSIQKLGTDGMFCSACDQFYPWAQANQPDGTLKCYECRQNPFR